MSSNFAGDAERTIVLGKVVKAVLRYWVDDGEMFLRVWYFDIRKIATTAWNIARFIGKVFGLYHILRLENEPSSSLDWRYPVCSLARRYTAATGFLMRSHLIDTQISLIER